MRCAPPPAAAAWWPAHVRDGSSATRPGSCGSESGLAPRARAIAAGRSGFTNMWLFWRTRNRFSLEELRYLTDQLQKVHVVNEANKDFVIEALRSIAELMIYGDQHDPSFFEYFMEKQIMGEFARVLRISKLSRVSLQLLQTMGIMIQNLRNEHSIYYIFSNEHINFLITYPFDFRIDEMLSYYISFLRAISGKLNKNTISLLVKTKNDEVTSFPLYVEALKFAFHEDSMIRVAIRTLTLNVYHVGDESVNRFVSRVPLSDYFSDMVQHFQKQCIDLDKLVARSSQNANSSLPMSSVEDAIVQIEDTLYYFSDVMSSGIPDLERFITENILQVLVFRFLLPSLQRQSTDLDLSVTTSMYLLCCILHIFKNKDMASTVAAALFHQPDGPHDRKQGTPNGYTSEHDNSKFENHCTTASAVEQSNEDEPHSLSSVSWKRLPNNSPPSDCCQGNTPREHLLSYITEGDDSQALGSLCLFATLLQTKELDESMLDALGILPQRKQHKKLLLQALVGEDLAERQLFSSSSGLTDDSICSDFDIYVRKLQDKYGLQCHHPRQMTSKAHRYQVLDALVDLFCRSKVSADVRLVGGWLFRQLLPHGEEEFTAFHLRRLKDSHKDCSSKLSEESGGCWCDMLLPIVKEAWRNCKKAIEASSPPKGSKSIIVPMDLCSFGGDSSVAIAEGVYEMVKGFVLQHQVILFCLGETFTEQPPIYPPVDLPVNTRANAADFGGSVPKPGLEVNLVDAVPCRIAFERGKERHFCFLAISHRTSGWILLLEQLPLKQERGIVRVMAPLAGSDPRIDTKHEKWLHLRIRPSSVPFLDTEKHKAKIKYLVDGRWTLAFSDEQSCKVAESMVIEEMKLQRDAVGEQLKPLVKFDMPEDGLQHPQPSHETPSDDGS
ncbi:protein TRANSPARENT TESTA 9-like isoform X1 [Miscanthus floridulus]|uniref:protein TRANSPARENT TESTA 9-like isoform X1 n=1 Tax=Miscanthus floridulus TaxID=154761 RepID=UPI00345B48C9